MIINKRESRTGLVWLVSATFLLSYACLGLFGHSLPGVEQLVSLMSNSSGVFFYLAAFLAILIEGTYLIGTFIPGTTTVTVLALLAQAGGMTMFLTTVFFIVAGWCTAGFINVFVASRLLKNQTVPNLDSLKVEDNIWVTWYPAFRANYEVAQIASGVPTMKVLYSALKVRLIASSIATVFILLVPFFIDITTVSNDEGFLSVLAVSLVCFAIASTHFSTRAKLTSENLKAIPGQILTRLGF